MDRDWRLAFALKSSGYECFGSCFKQKLMSDHSNHMKVNLWCHLFRVLGSGIIIHIHGSFIVNLLLKHKEGFLQGHFLAL